MRRVRTDSGSHSPGLEGAEAVPWLKKSLRVSRRWRRGGTGDGGRWEAGWSSGEVMGSGDGDREGLSDGSLLLVRDGFLVDERMILRVVLMDGSNVSWQTRVSSSLLTSSSSSLSNAETTSSSASTSSSISGSLDICCRGFVVSDGLLLCGDSREGSSSPGIALI